MINITPTSLIFIVTPRYKIEKKLEKGKKKIKKWAANLEWKYRNEGKGPTITLVKR